MYLNPFEDHAAVLQTDGESVSVSAEAGPRIRAEAETADVGQSHRPIGDALFMSTGGNSLEGFFSAALDSRVTDSSDRSEQRASNGRRFPPARLPRLAPPTTLRLQTLSTTEFPWLVVV